MLHIYELERSTFLLFVDVNQMAPDDGRPLAGRVFGTTATAMTEKAWEIGHALPASIRVF